MYKNVGREIKNVAQAIVVLLAAPAVLLGVALCFVLGKSIGFFGVVIGIGIIVVGILLARLSGMVIYGFGELVENSAEIRKNLRNNDSAHDVGENTEEGVESKAKVEVSGNGKWVCPRCYYTNSADDKSCKICHTEVILE